MELHILLVEDNDEERDQFVRDLPGVFAAKGITARIDSKSTFEEGIASANDAIVRYDLVISDTYKGPLQIRNAEVLKLVDSYKRGKFCPLIVISNGDKPPTLTSTAFVRWVSKTNPEDLTNAINEVLDLGIPQLARELHEQIDSSAGNFLWNFVEKNWDKLASSVTADPTLLNRLIRRRASLMISDLIPSEYAAVPHRYGLEYYIYPALEHGYFSLGDILRSKARSNELRVVMTPHCYLFKQAGQTQPRANFVLTIRTVLANDLIGEKLENAKETLPENKRKKLKNWTNSPAKEVGKPDGRYWYLPSFLQIPHCFCDFLRLESVEYTDLVAGYESIATLVPPYAEAMQACFLNFYSAVGISNIDPVTAVDMINSFESGKGSKKVTDAKKVSQKKKSKKKPAKKSTKKSVKKPAKKPAKKKS